MFCRQLKNLGAHVLGVADTPYDQLAPEVRDALTEYYRVDDMHNYDALVRACGYFTHKYGKIDRFESLNEYWLETEARIRDDFNIFGVRTNTIGFIRKKSMMKEKFRQASVAVAPGAVVRSLANATALVAETGYPVVAKPDGGVGALATYRLDDESDLAAFFQTQPSEDYIMEAFVHGDIYSFDGLADRDGRPVFYTAHTYSQGIMETVNEGRHVSYYSLREIPAQLEALGRRCLESFDVRERFFHIEFFRTDADQYVALEVNMRPPGGYTTDMFNYTADIDIYRAWAELLVHGRSHLDYERRYHCCYASRKQAARYAHAHEEVLSRFGRLILQVESVPGVFRSALGDIGYIFRAPDLEQVLEAVRFIHAPGSAA
jgi:biotin carboxylase